MRSLLCFTAHTDSNMASSSSSNLLASVGSDGGCSVATAAANSHSGDLHQVIAGRYLVWGHAGTLPQLHAQVGQLGRDTGVHESPVSFVQDVAKFGPAQLQERSSAAPPSFHHRAFLLPSYHTCTAQRYASPSPFNQIMRVQSPPSTNPPHLMPNTNDVPKEKRNDFAG